VRLVEDVLPAASGGSDRSLGRRIDDDPAEAAMASARACGDARARRGAAAAGARRRLGPGLKGDAARESGAGAIRTAVRTSAGLRRSPGGRRRLGPDGLRAGWRRATTAGGPGRAGLRFGPRWAVGPKCNSSCAKEQGALADFKETG
jgi:hypothetical protein